MRSFGYYLMPGRWLQSNNNYKVLLRNIIGFSTNYYLECTAKGRGKREDRSLIDGVSLGRVKGCRKECCEAWYKSRKFHINSRFLSAVSPPNQARRLNKFPI